MMLKRESNFLKLANKSYCRYCKLPAIISPKPPPPSPPAFKGPFTSCKQKDTSDYNSRLACIEMNSTFYKVPKLKKAIKFKK